VLALRIDEDHCLAAEAVIVLLDDTANKERRDSGVKRVAAAGENLQCGGGRQRMAG